MSPAAPDRNHFIGIVSPSCFGNKAHVKRLLLMFDRLAIDTAHGDMDRLHQLLTSGDTDFQIVRDEGLISTVSGIVADADYQNGMVRSAFPSVIGADILSDGLEINAEEEVARIVGPTITIDKQLRESAARLRKLNGFDAVAVPVQLRPPDIDSTADRDSVIRITLTEFPMPADSNSWESIVSFRSEAETKKKFLRLKRWIDKTARIEVPKYEVYDELRELLYEFEMRMLQRRMPVKITKLDVRVSITDELASEHEKIESFSDDSRSYLLSPERLSLLPSERQVGQEVEYIFDARARFSSL